jgi:hypothetical protein
VFPQELIYILPSIRLANFVHTSALTIDLEVVQGLNFFVHELIDGLYTMLSSDAYFMQRRVVCVCVLKWGYMKASVFWSGAPRSLVKIYQSLRGA